MPLAAASTLTCLHSSASMRMELTFLDTGTT
jgi:hypothetical protein